MPSSSSSADALARLPSLSLSRTMSSWLRVPSGSARGTTKHGQPVGRLREHQEHVVHRRRGEPLVPVQGVLALDAGRPRLGDVGADVGAALLLGHAHAGERAALLGDRPDARVVRRRGERRRSTPSPARSSTRSAGTAAYVIEIGQPCAGLGVGPGHEAGRAAYVGVRRRRPPAAPTAPPGARDRPRAPSASARTGGRRPRRCGGRSGRTSSARARAGWPGRPCSRASAVPAAAPSSSEVVDDLGPAWRVTASTRAASAVTTLCPTSGGAWFVAARFAAVMWLTVGPCPMPSRRALRRVRPTRAGTVSPGLPWVLRARETTWRIIVSTVGLLDALPRDRAGGGGGVLHGAVGAAADLRARRRDRLRHPVVQPRPGRPRAHRDPRPRPRASSPTPRSTRSSSRPSTTCSRAGGSTSSRSASCSPCGRGRGRCTSSSTPSRSCTGSVVTAGSSRPGRCPSPSTCWRSSPGSSRCRWSWPARAWSAEALPARADFLVSFYWPTVLVLSICFLATLYHVSIPVRTKWRINLPGATFALAVWLLGSFLLREFLTVTAADSRSIYGPLAAPIAVLLWLYILSIAVLIGAALNAAFDTRLPPAADRARADGARPTSAPPSGARRGRRRRPVD